MKAIVLRQPWATLIALGIKTIETRPSPPNGDMRPEGVRGLPGCTLNRGDRLAIVAGAAASKAAPWEAPEAWSLLVDPENPARVAPQYAPLVFGAVVAVATITDTLPIVEPGAVMRPAGHGRWIAEPVLNVGSLAMFGVHGDLVAQTQITDQLPLGDFTPGRWGWLLADVTRLDNPIPCKGRQGVFELPADVARNLTYKKENER